MRLKPGSASFVVFLAALTTVTPLSMDMYLPSLPSIQLAFHANVAQVQLTLSIFMIGAAGSQLIYGPMSDRFGRRPALIVGYGFYVTASLGCLLAHSIETLAFARFLQALGGGSAMVLARAIVRDVYAAEAAGAMLARMSAIMGLVPALAPMLGGLVERSFGWQSNFIIMSVGGLALATATFAGLEETLPPHRRQHADMRVILSHYRRLLKDQRFLRYLLISAFCFGGMFAYISGSSFVLQVKYGLSPVAFGMCFGIMVVGYIGGTLTGARFTHYFGIERMLVVGTGIAFAGGLLLVLLHFSMHGSAVIFVLPIVVYAFGVGLTMPQSIAGALTPFPDIAGTASALMGFLQSVFSATTGAFVGHMLRYGAAPMVLSIAVLGMLSFTVACVGPARKRV